MLMLLTNEQKKHTKIEMFTKLSEMKFTRFLAEAALLIPSDQRDHERDGR